MFLSRFLVNLGKSWGLRPQTPVLSSWRFGSALCKAAAPQALSRFAARHDQQMARNEDNDGEREGVTPRIYALNLRKALG